MKNWDCDGDRCSESRGDVRVYPLGGGGNLILCHSCWAHENRYRHIREVETKNPGSWPQHDWAKAENYPTNDGEKP